MIYWRSAPSAAPKDITVVIQSSISVLIQWSPPDADQQNGVIQHYQIEVYNPQNGATVQHTSAVALYTLTGLHPNYTYVVRVAAVTVASGPQVTAEFQMPGDGKTLVVQPFSNDTTWLL